MPRAKRRKRNSGEALEIHESEAIPPRCVDKALRVGKVVTSSVSESEDDQQYDHMSDDEEGGIRIGDIYIPPAPKPALTFDSTGPRMVISHIVNINFKSYAGTQYLGPFHKSFTAIIGPNGSGKSNVIDSMLFVFGYRSTKIRSKKISVLIHSSSKFPNINSATVSVHFRRIIDVGDDYTVVPDSAIEVSRTAFRDSSSHYMLNKKRVPFKEVAKLLRSYGIDLTHNRFLILQGEVEQIAMMKPKGMTEHETGMLEYLEDIVGTSRYKEPIEKISDAVDELVDERKEKLNRVRMVEAEKLKLEPPMREAVELVNLNNEATRTRNMLLQKYSHEVKKMILQKEEEKGVAQALLDEMDQRLENISSQLVEKNAILNEGSSKYEVLMREKEEITKKLQACKKKIVTVLADTTQANKKKKNLNQLMEQERGKLIEFELIPEKNTREISDCEKLLLKLNESKRKADEELQTVVAGVRAQTQGLQETKDRLQATLMDLKRIVDEANKSFKLAESELKIYLSTEQKETAKLEKMRESYEKANTDLVQKKRMKHLVSSTLPDKEREVSQLQSQLDDIKGEEATVLSQARSLRSQLEESRQTMSANRSRGRVLDSLMREKRNGNLPGIFGRLGDLGGIDIQYDVAISTCCSALDNIVVDTADTAQSALEYLKRNDVGRVTCIALDKQTHLIAVYQKIQNFPEDVLRIFDLIRVNDQRVLPAFYYALRDTLLANDLEQASRIAYGRTRYRVVTFSGDVIEISGTMAGGGKSKLRGKMTTSVQQDTSTDQNPSVIRENERTLASLESRLSELRSQQGRIEDTLRSLNKAVRDEKMSLDKINIELRSLTEQVPLIQNQINQQERRVEASRVDEEGRARLESAIEEAKLRLEDAKHNAGEIEKKLHDVNAQISAIAGGRVQAIQKQSDDLSNKITKINTEITKLKVAITGSIRNANKSKDKFAQMEADYAETERNLENLLAEKRQLTLDSKQSQKKVEEIDEKISEGTDEYAGLRKEIAKLHSTQNKIKSGRIESVNALNLLERSIHDFTMKMPVWDREVAGLQLEDVGEDNLEIEVPGLEPQEPLKTHTPEELDAVAVDELRSKSTLQKQRLGNEHPNLQAIKNYRATEATYLKRVAELEEITARRNEMRAVYDSLRKKRQNDFMIGFNTITAKLKEMYQTITLGGDAELELVDSLDPFTEGVIFSVRPPNKSWKNISNLSGGEKTLSSLSLVFALHYYKPTPLYIMDEIDAALDFKNVSIVANYIKERTRNAQFVIISLRYIMFEASNRLVGIYKVADCTRSVTINNFHEPDEDATPSDTQQQPSEHELRMSTNGAGRSEVVTF